MEHIPAKRPRPGESGQAVAVLLIILAVFLLGVLGLATDYAQIWAHRQTAQSAADAACQAGAADLFLNYEKATGVSGGVIDLVSFSWIGSPFDCSSYSTSNPVCGYAAVNGYSGSSVRVTFPGSVDGAPSLGGYGAISYPYNHVTVSDDIPLTFSRLLQSTSTSFPVKASATCGISPVSVPIPIVVLNKTASGSLTMSGTPIISILGGPPRSIQVDSSSQTAIVGNGTKVGNSYLDLSGAGPEGNGADIGVFGNEQQLPTKNLNLGSKPGKWVSPAFPYGDPWIAYNEPSIPGAAGSVIVVGYGVNGCPDQAGCTEFSPGNYSGCANGVFNSGAAGCLVLPVKGINLYTRTNNASYPAGAEVLPTSASGNAGNFVYVAVQGSMGTSGGAEPAWSTAQAIGQSVTDGTVTWKNVGKPTASPYGTSIFDPGLYYLDGNGMQLGSGSTVRPSTATGDGSYGTTFYFSQPCTGNKCNILSVNANSGKPSNTINSYTVAGDAFSVPLQCPAGGSNPPQLKETTLRGNILLGPCTGTYAGRSTDGHTQYRGFLFFGSHSSVENPNWGGGGSFLLSGFMYFHDETYGSTLSLSGGSNSDSYTLGNIVADNVTLQGNSGIKMILNPSSSYQILRPTLLQ